MPETAHPESGDTLTTPAGSKARAARAVGHSILTRIGIIVLNMGTGILTARMLHPDGRGQQAAMTLWPLFLANATALGTPSSMIYHLRRRAGAAWEPLVASGLAMVTLLGLVAAFVGALVLPHWLHEYPADIVRWAQLFLLTAPLWAVQITGQSALEALGQFSRSNVVQVMIPATTLTGLLTFLALGRFNPVTAAFCYTVAIVPTSATIVAMLWRRRTPGAIALRWAACRTLLGYGIRSAPLDLLGTLALYLDQVLVIGLLTQAEMGSYTVVLSLSRALLLFQASVVMVLFPMAAGRERGEIVAMVGEPVRLNTILTGAAALTACVLGPLALRLMYGVQYLSAVPALRVLVAEVVVQGAVVVMSQAFMAAGRPGIVSILQGTGLALAAPLMLVLIPRYGVTGAAMALLCSTCARFGLIYASFPVFLGERLPRVVPGVADVKTLWRLIRKRI
ncbi:Membrane protein involved in the export of O-antigen and teichoic acid [Granulicella rosea]|uniref:Membrane protein involved in the export of O-antigen and teichoic acid n=1 Tax=Granulicella rosea TaxID=474952 RepID=A0A239L035_9BACT|nr:polysaccharide biosynthesis C-terminal domain-containing protein [Granulicella rosea]SNT23947.1 Membrane protein involved in the export of O-antigen and teichoic acid [Granulicella rosea]